MGEICILDKEEDIDNHICPICKGKQLCYCDTCLCPKCDREVIDELWWDYQVKKGRIKLE